MGEDLKSLLKRRSIIKAGVTNFATYLQPIELISTANLTKQVVNALQLKLTRFQELLSELDIIQDKIVNLVEQNQLDEQIQERDRMENTFYDLISRASCVVESFTEKNSAHLSQASLDNESNKSLHFNTHANIKLPTIKLPIFDGTYTKWLEFRDTFDELINKNITIPKINKFHYLRSSLEGGASVVLKSIEFTSDNYDMAWQQLCDRFDNKRILINNHLKALFSFNPITKESYKSLRYMVDYFSKNLSSLNKLNEPTTSWDTLIIYMMAAKLDGATGRQWEEHRNSITISPTLDDFYRFLRGRADMLETLEFNKGTPKYSFGSTEKQSFNNSRKSIASFFESSNNSNFSGCVVCDQKHPLYQCEKFKSMSLEDRWGVVQANHLCQNCLRAGHHAKRCRLGPCTNCRKKHNTLLHKFYSSTSQHTTTATQGNTTTTHQDDSTNRNQKNSTNTTSKGNTTTTNVTSSDTTATSSIVQSPVTLSATISGQVLLCTAEVELVNTKTNSIYRAKALLDAGSQSSFVTEKVQRIMNLSCSKTSPMSIIGINNATTRVTKYCDLQVKSRVNSFRIKVSCLVIPQITSMLPSVQVDTSRLNLPSNVTLADPSFYRPSEIQVLLGADVFWEIVDCNQIKLGRNKPTLQQSKFGWLVAGPTGSNSANSDTVRCNFTQEISQRIARFWELEDIPSYTTVKFTKDEEFCETHFIDNTIRLPDGRFSVKMPLRKNPEEALGDSYHIAKKRFLNLERKLNKTKQKKDYAEFIREYERLGHLAELQNPPSFGYYIPHHAIIRASSETTRLRVVFDASCKTSTGNSLNDIQLVGPVVQDDLLSILLRFRQNTYVVTGDIEKMYRQVMIDGSQRNLQLILWRDDESEPLKTLQLKTVTYGTASAPYLSTRCLVQLAEECTDETVADVIKHGFYVDDLSTSSNNKSELKNVVRGVILKLSEACFNLRKFRTNAPDIFADIPTISQTQDFSKESSVLGLKWNPETDKLQFSACAEANPNITKRNILSTSCRVFDPLGLLSACTVTPKLLLQRLWLLQLDWDQQVPEEIGDSWREFLHGLHYITNIQVPRHVLCKSPVNIEIHVFTDASQHAYGACLYLKSNDISGNVHVNLVCAKTRVAPLKPEMTIPRMELLGALLGARLYAKVTKSLRINVSRSMFWSDSKIVLGWLRTQPKTLKTFVCNRIDEVRELTDRDAWRHVPTEVNPADLASRGVKPQQLINNALWWHGPSFLTIPESEWPLQSDAQPVPLPETKIKITLNLQCQENAIPFDKFSRLYKLQRVFAYVLRFISNCGSSSNKVKGELTIAELEKSLKTLAKLAQRESFAKDIHSLTNNKALHPKSRIISLNPFLDDEGIMRVGGRIDQALHCPYDKRHPILIDSKHSFTKLLFDKEHLRLLHCGPQQLLCSVRDQFWPTGGRMLARSVVNKCVRCQRLAAASKQPLMGNLPGPRVTPASPFENCGVDFAGPFLISNKKGRGSRTTKCYLCIFVCLAVKAVHLEVVSDLSAAAFIMCLKRFIARRGKPRMIYCDNGKNFVGAMNELGKLLQACNRDVNEFACDEGIVFKFSPAYSPNFGGIWEAGVKSAKFHLKRIVGSSSLTFEELSTLLAQIESILNSRPLTPMSADPSDLRPLTPGHFLIGRPLTALPSPNVERISVNRYQLLERLRQAFWNRWNKEYLSALQQRVKWRTNKYAVKIGDLVIVRDNQLPVMKWLLGRVTAVYPGPDGITRVVDVKTSKGLIRRALSQLCPLQLQ